ncbi:MAG: hypothetical protein ACI9HY_001712 [Planctomycetaceae bacterium]|jgi:hypothetical protein
MLIKSLMLACCLLSSISVQAHMLNMTHIDITVDAEQQAVITLRIDLGQSLMTAEDYWVATQAIGSSQRALLQPTLDRLGRDLSFLLDGTVQQPQLTGFEISATSLAAIQNPLTPQMATLNYQLDVSGGTYLNVQLADQLEIPWPCLMKIDIAGQALPQSRLLTNVDRLSRDTLVSSGAANLETDGLAQLVYSWSRLAPEFTWVAVGFQHIVPNGLDHMLFILGLFFLAGGWRSLLLQVTGFTLAHSLTLGMSMVGIISLPMSIVEPLIALSIVYVAIDNLYATKLARWRLVIVCLFGLLHGLGFASVLANIGLPQDQFLLSLGLFNLGVELGQLAVIAGAFLMVGWFSRQTWYQSNIAQPATIAIAGTGAYWFLKRIAF